MPWIPIAAAGAGAVGGIASGLIGAASSASDRAAAQQAYQQTVNDLNAIGIPPEQAQQIALQRYQSAGNFNPNQEQGVQLGQSNMAGISTDPNYLAAQKQALSNLQQIGTDGGMTLSDRAQLEKSMGNVQAQERGARGAILQDAAQRGGYGSGSALASQLINSQGGANQAHSDALNIQAQAQARALQAIQGAGQLGSNLQQQEFGQKAQQAQAQDAINQWNAQNQQSLNTRNTGTTNSAQQYNLANQQNLMNSNTDTANKEQVYNQSLPQQYFQNQLQVAGMKGNARAGQASNLQNNAQQTSNMWGGIGSSVAQGAGAVGQYYATQQADQANRDAYNNRTKAMYGSQEIE